MQEKKDREIELFLDLGMQPVSNMFTKPNSTETNPHYPIRLMLKKETGHIYLETPFPVEEVKPRYEWLTCFEPENHLDAMVEKIVNLSGVSKESVFAGYSFKDDSTLARLRAKDYQKQWRLEPQADLGVLDPCANVETYQNVFTIAKAVQIQKLRA